MWKISVLKTCFLLITSLSSCNHQNEMDFLSEHLDKALYEISSRNDGNHNRLLNEVDFGYRIRVSYKVNNAENLRNFLNYTKKNRNSIHKKIQECITKNELLALVKKYEQDSENLAISRTDLSTRIFFNANKNEKELARLSLRSLKLLARWDWELIFDNDLNYIWRRIFPGRCVYIPLQLDKLSLNHALYVAVYENKLAEVKKLISKGADINYLIGISDYYYLPILSYAIQHDHLEISHYLIQQGADIHAQDKEGNTPLSSACWINDMGLVKLLVKKGAKVDLSETIFPPIRIAMEIGNMEMQEYLESHIVNQWPNDE